MSQGVKQERGNGAKFPETDLMLFLPLFVVYVVFSETAYKKFHYQIPKQFGSFSNGKSHVNKKLLILEVVLRMFLCLFLLLRVS